jgi:hypothetical protein
MERRHIREAEVWIARQVEIVAQLDLMGADDFALKARELLVLFREFLTFARERLDYLERKLSSKPPPSN